MYVYHDLTQTFVPMIRGSKAWFEKFFNQRVNEYEVKENLKIFKNSRFVKRTIMKKGTISSQNVDFLFESLFLDRNFLDAVDDECDRISFFLGQNAKEKRDLKDRFKTFILCYSFHETAGTLNPLELKAESGFMNILTDRNIFYKGGASGDISVTDIERIRSYDFGVGPCHLQESFHLFDSKGGGTLTSNEYNNLYLKERERIFNNYSCQGLFPWDEQKLKEVVRDAKVWRGRPNFVVTKKRAEFLQKQQPAAYFTFKQRARLSERTDATIVLTMLEIFRATHLREDDFWRYGATESYPKFNKFSGKISYGFLSENQTNLHSRFDAWNLIHNLLGV